MSNNQSSIDYLISQLQKSKYWHRVLNEVSQMSSGKVDIIAQAKAMHKEEIINAMYASGYIGGPTDDETEQYYNDTFK